MPLVLTGAEKDLLLCCARTTMDADSAARIRVLLRDDIDWSALLQTALRHGVMPLLYRSLSTYLPGCGTQSFP